MENLTNLIRLRNNIERILKNIDVSSILKDKTNFIIDGTFTEQCVGHESIISELTKSYNSLTEYSELIIKKAQHDLKLIDLKIQSIAELRFANDNYRSKMSEDCVYSELRTNQVELETIFQGKIHSNAIYNFPILCIEPRHKKFIDMVVAGDPVYLSYPITSPMLESNIYTMPNTLESAINEYSEIFQNRLRIYPINNRNFSVLPQEQFGFILCWEVFEHLSFDKVEKYFIEVYHLLRPGGTFFFTYANCELPETMHWAEFEEVSYSTKSKVRNSLETIGYTIKEFTDYDLGEFRFLSWCEVKKPGNLSTIKLRQPLGKIIE